MKSGKPNRGSQPAIPAELWPHLQRLEGAKKTLAEIGSWLVEQHGIKASAPTISRVLARIRAAAPPPEAKPEPPMLEPATDNDELRLLRAHFWGQARDPNQSARDQQGAARLLLSIRAEKRAARPLQPGAPVPPPAGQPVDATPAMTPEQEAEAVREQLRQRN